jgi:chromosome segregation ATPase
MTKFTPVQQKAIQSWTEERDKLLKEIGIYTTERDDRKREANDEALRLTDLQKSIAEARGRIAELDTAEDRRKTSVSIEVAELEARKSRLEGECAEKKKELEGATEEYRLIVSATFDLHAAHDTMKDQAQIVKSVVSDIIETSKGYLSDSKVLMTDIRTIATEVIEKGNENVKQTGIILDKLPRYIFELQRPIPVRRAFATPKGTIIRPEAENQA